MIEEEMKDYKDSTRIVSCTLTDEQLDVEFDSSFGWVYGEPFTLWTEKRVYFPVCYDGAEWVGSVSRDPDGVSTDHMGNN